ncbi:hypothetical protein BKA70DRAFT_1178135 [Coprinopsis sp. MPI-PUGE-AT-0042]|nr:hypothetical protein BKA70DRAFT_1178135 [Coprinopsis sp. MPI-PUGE-AT-0042]
MSSPDRQELVRNAVSFLSDPKTAASPLAQKLQFLEAKGLTPSEIDIALKQSATNVSVPQPYGQPYGQPFGMMPPQQRWDWRDYFITGVVSGTVVYGAVSLFKKFLLPHLQPPSSTAYEEDRDALTAQFDAAEALLKEIQAETAAVRAAVVEQKQKVDEATENVNSAVAEMREGEAKTRDEIREIRDEVNTIREMLPKMIEKNKDSQNQSLSELQQELKSLKALLLSRGPTASAVPSPTLNFGRPSIPAWQLATSSLSRNPELKRPQSPASVPLPQSPAVRPSKLADSPPLPELSRLDSESKAEEKDLDTASAKEGGEARKLTSKDAPSSEVKDNVDTVGKPEPSVQAAEEVPSSSPKESASAVASEEGPMPDDASSHHGSTTLPSDAPHPEPTFTSATHESSEDKDTSSLAPAATATVENDSPAEKAIGNEAVADPTPQLPAEKTATDTASAPPAPSQDAPMAKVEPPAKDTVVEELQQRLKQVEQRFTDVSTSFKRLQAEKRAADAVLRQFTPLETIQDDEGLSDYLKNVQSKITVSRDEINRLNSKLEDYENQLEDLRQVHVSETSSKADDISKLRVQLKETEALFQASEKRITQLEDSITSQQSSSTDTASQLDKYRAHAKEEEEKRVKAISLLKTVRQKLVKTEKERDDALQKAATSKEVDKEEVERERAERLRLQRDLESVQAEKDKALAMQKSQFEKELALAKEKAERELAAVKGQLELDIITLKATHSKELTSKSSRISTLENSLNNVSRDKNSFFEQLQIRQAETESAQGHLESLQHQNSELEFQLREANDRLALLREEYTEYQREQEVRAREPSTSPEEIARMISATESRYEAKLGELRRNVEVLEKERSESEANWSRKHKDKVREVEELNRLLGTTAKSREEDIGVAERLRAELASAREEARTLREQLVEVPGLRDRIEELKRNVHEHEKEAQLRLAAIEKQIEESKARETQLKQANKTLKEELRKVQSSAALLERQRNPGVGYWNRSEEPGSSPTVASPGPPASAVSTTSRNEEAEVNLEYLRNVVLQFLENKEMRPNLVKVISIILHFTPQETRRLMAKV